MGVQINGSEGNVIATKGTYSGNVTIGGTLTYEDVTNVDSVGLVTARNGIEIGARPGVAASISVDGNAIFSGITTIGSHMAVGGVTPETFGGGHVTLEVAGSTTSQGGVFKTATSDSAGTGSSGTEMILFTDSAKGSVNVVSSDPLTFSTANTERARITSAGLVGIGTVSPAHALDIQGSSASFTKIALSNQTMNTSKYEIIFGDQGQVNHVVAANREFTIATGGTTERLRITSAGLVGINETPTIAQFQVRSSQLGGTAGNTQEVVRLHSPDVTNTTSYRFTNYRVSDGTSHSSSELRFRRHVDATDMGYFGLGDGYASIGYGTAEKVRITSAGRVGIGENSPDALLHLSTGASATCELRLQANNTGSGSGDRGRINVYSSRNDGTAYQAGYVDIDRSSGTEDKAHLLVALNDGSGATERLRITSSGIVTKSYQPYFVARAGSNRDNVTDQVLVFSTAVRNNGSHYNTGNSRFTAPVTGAYIFGGTPAYQETSDTMSINIRVNGSTVYEVERVVANSMNQHSMFGFSTLLYLSATDYVELYVSGQCHQNGSYSHWFGYLLG